MIKKESTLIVSAWLSFLLGHALVWVDFFLSDALIHSETLWYFGQSLIYTGSALGISVYIKSKFSDIYHQINYKQHAQN